MEEKTTLQKIKEQLEKKMTRAIVQAIEDGAKYEKQMGGLVIDGVYFPSSLRADYYGLVLRIDVHEIDQLFKPKTEDLKKRAEELRAEMEEIENQLKSE